MEIERKFLLSGFPDLPELEKAAAEADDPQGVPDLPAGKRTQAGMQPGGPGHRHGILLR